MDSNDAKTSNGLTETAALCEIRASSERSASFMDRVIDSLKRNDANTAAEIAEHMDDFMSDCAPHARAILAVLDVVEHPANADNALAARIRFEIATAFRRTGAR